jgi:hypothetical protein
MKPNPRSYIRSLHRTVFEENPVIVTFIQLKRIIDIYFKLSEKSKKLSQNIFENKEKLEKMKSNMEKPMEIGYFNIMR